jgi:hypothetical protein
MAKLPSVNIFNEERIKALKINTAADEAMLLTVDETREYLRIFKGEWILMKLSELIEYANTELSLH